jgi:hypothetical protein
MMTRRQIATIAARGTREVAAAVVSGLIDGPTALRIVRETPARQIKAVHAIIRCGAWETKEPPKRRPKPRKPVDAAKLKGRRLLEYVRSLRLEFDTESGDSLAAADSFEE